MDYFWVWLIFILLFLFLNFIFNFLPDYERKKDEERKKEKAKQEVERHKQEHSNELKRIGNTQEYQDFLKVVVRHFDKEGINNHSESFGVTVSYNDAKLGTRNMLEYDFEEKGFTLKSPRDFVEKLEMDLKKRYPDFDYKQNYFTAYNSGERIPKRSITISIPKTEIPKPLKQI